MAARMAAEIRPLPISVLVHIVNEWGDAPRVEAHEETQPYPSAESLREESPEVWADFPGLDDETLVETANLVHPVFAAASGAECAERLNALVLKAKMAPALESDASAVREVWRTSRPDRALLAAAVLSLIDQLRHEPDATRLGTCVGDACVDVYVDRSPAGRRRYCSLTCQNRARTRAYRASRRAAAEASP